MQAAVIGRYGPPDAIRIETRDDPLPRAGQLLVRVESAAVTSGDARIRAGRFPAGFGALARLAIGLRGPRRSILGGTFSGVVEALGPDSGDFAVGDAVAGMTGARFGAHAELLVAPTRSTTRKPEALSHDAAAAVLFGGSTALHFLHERARQRRFGVRRDQRDPTGSERWCAGLRRRELPQPGPGDGTRGERGDRLHHDPGLTT